MNANKSTGQVMIGRLLQYAVIIKAAKEWEDVEAIQNKVFELLDLVVILHRNHQISESEAEDVEAAWYGFVGAAEAVEGRIV